MATRIVTGAKPKDVGVCVQRQASRVMGIRLQPVSGSRVLFSMRAGAIDGTLKRVASWLKAGAGDALTGKPSGFEQLERMGARPSKPHNWDEAFREYAR